MTMKTKQRRGKVRGRSREQRWEKRGQTKNGVAVR
jgi:hypothetical protein